MRALILAAGAVLILAACDPTWATLVENAGDRPVIVRIQTRQFNGDDDFSTDYIVAPDTRIQVGGNGVASVGQIVRISVLDEACQIVASDPISGFDEGGVVRIEPDGRLSMTAGGNPTTGDEAVTFLGCT